MSVKLPVVMRADREGLRAALVCLVSKLGDDSLHPFVLAQPSHELGYLSSKPCRLVLCRFDLVVFALEVEFKRREVFWLLAML